MGSWIVYGLGSESQELPGLHGAVRPRRAIRSTARSTGRAGSCPRSTRGPSSVPRSRGSSTSTRRRSSRATSSSRTWRCSTSSTAGTSTMHPGEADLEVADPELRAGRGHADRRQGGARHLQRARVHQADVRARRRRHPRVRHPLPDRPPAGRARGPVRPALPRRPAVGQSQHDPEEPAGDLPAHRQARRGAGEGPQAARAAGDDARPLGRRDRPAAGQSRERSTPTRAATTTARGSRSGWPAAESREA